MPLRWSVVDRGELNQLINKHKLPLWTYKDDVYDIKSNKGDIRRNIHKIMTFIMLIYVFFYRSGTFFIIVIMIMNLIMTAMIMK